MKFVQLALLALAFITGLLSARYWFKASKVTTDPGWGRDGVVEPGVHSQAQDAWIVVLLQSASESARLNKVAAGWTAITAALTAISAAMSVL